jgi:acetyl/propionyl-CoA carboxylase alpha subunit
VIFLSFLVPKGAGRKRRSGGGSWNARLQRAAATTEADRGGAGVVAQRTTEKRNGTTGKKRREKCFAVSLCVYGNVNMQAEKVCERAGYVTTGTVEFLLDLNNGKHYFLEVNTRLQVEHTVSEEVLGVDLVRLQILTARGASLASLGLDKKIVMFFVCLFVCFNTVQREVGHSLQMRVCAEDEQLQPSVGVLRVCRWPLAGARVEAGVRAGSEIGPHYDSMLAKIIVKVQQKNNA